MAVMGQLLKPKKTEITDKLRQEINKVCVLNETALWLADRQSEPMSSARGAPCRQTGL